MLRCGPAAAAPATFVHMVNPFDPDAIVAAARFHVSRLKRGPEAFIQKTEQLGRCLNPAARRPVHAVEDNNLAFTMRTNLQTVLRKPFGFQAHLYLYRLVIPRDEASLEDRPVNLRNSRSRV